MDPTVKDLQREQKKNMHKNYFYEQEQNRKVAHLPQTHKIYAICRFLF